MQYDCRTIFSEKKCTKSITRHFIELAPFPLMFCEMSTQRVNSKTNYLNESLLGDMQASAVQLQYCTGLWDRTGATGALRGGHGNLDFGSKMDTENILYWKCFNIAPLCECDQRILTTFFMLHIFHVTPRSLRVMTRPLPSAYLPPPFPHTPYTTASIVGHNFR